MVHIEKDYSNPPTALLDSKWNKLKADALVNPNHEAKSECYRDTTLETLAKLYNNKCACCERERGIELHVDHYRPRKARNNKTKIEYNHSGYHWLTYEWSNLIPLCSSCNTSKSNYFPLKENSKKVYNNTIFDAKSLNLTEKPLFINPEIELHPAKHFQYLSNGKVKGKTDEGEETVKLYQLNHINKTRERRKIIINYILEIRNITHIYLKSKEVHKEIIFKATLETIFRKVLKNTEKKEPFSLMHLYIRIYFEEFITKVFSIKMQIAINNYFQEYLKIRKINTKLT